MAYVAAAREYERQPDDDSVGMLLAKAAVELDAAIAAGVIERAPKGLVAAEIRRHWPSQEGQGDGWTGPKHYSTEKINKLVQRFIHGPRDTPREELWNEGYSKDEIRHALVLAPGRIDDSERLYEASSGQKRSFTRRGPSHARKSADLDGDSWRSNS